MNELEVGMHVRTKQGYIAKFKEYDEIFDILRFETPIFLRSWMPCDYMQKERFMNRYFLKASNNIIDLIEVGDYVNSYPVYEIVEYEDNTRAIVIADDNKSIIWEESSKYIKSIVTKEQFESMSYKVGD